MWHRKHTYIEYVYVYSRSTCGTESTPTSSMCVCILGVHVAQEAHLHPVFACALQEYMWHRKHTYIRCVRVYCRSTCGTGSTPTSSVCVCIAGVHVAQEAHLHPVGRLLQDFRPTRHGVRLPESLRHLRLPAEHARWRPRNQPHRRRHGQSKRCVYAVFLVVRR